MIENVLIFIATLLFVLVVIINLYCMYYFRKNKKAYDLLLSEYRRLNLDIDIITNYAVFFGPLVNYQKIIWFVRLYKGVKMKFTKDRYVQKEAYQFVQSLPDSKIRWILKLHRLYKIQAYITALWLITCGILYLVVHNQ
ncbi:hypothetical protein [uncultured Pluralibacter sp.]|uniref:hypothetical protein n=1 Tax=uncultured Pluralibacter sp. TaxID=1490864 RepID=UPI002615DB74|nr:hypothetical protein [uncultured Pluralibacter sp.]